MVQQAERYWQQYVKYAGKIVAVEGHKLIDGNIRMPKWRQDRDQHLYNGTITTQNLIQIPAEELVIEFDHLNNVALEAGQKEAQFWTDKVKAALSDLGLYFIITDHKGKSSHTRLFIEGLDSQPSEIAREYKRRFVEELLKTIGFSSDKVTLDWSLITSEEKLISIVGQAHWKAEWKGAIEQVVFENAEGSIKPMSKDAVKEIMKSLSSGTKPDNNIPQVKLENVDVAGLKGLWEKYYKEPYRNRMLMAFGGVCRRAGLTFEESNSILQQLLECVNLLNFFPTTSRELSYCFMENKKPQELAVFHFIKDCYGDKAKQIYGEFLACFKAEHDQEAESPSQADRIVELVLENVTLFKDELNEPCAAFEMPPDKHRELWALKSKAFKRWICSSFYDAYKKAPSSSAVNDAINVLGGKAMAESKQYTLNNRVALHEGSIYYDLSDSSWQAVKISEQGWEMIKSPPILFRRYSHQKKAIIPERSSGGKQALDNIMSLYRFEEKDFTLKDVVNLLTKRNFRKVNLLVRFIPDIPQIIHVDYGPQGSSKTTIAKAEKMLIDPSAVQALSMPRDKTEAVQQLSHHWFLVYDNISYLCLWLSDLFCRAVTGDGFSKRELYTDDDDVIYSFRRCLTLNGINAAAGQPDLLDRAVLFPFRRIPKAERLTEARFWEIFNENAPKALGYIFDTISKAMAIKEKLDIKELPRMADFVLWGEAISQALGYAPMQYVQTFFESISDRNKEVIESHVVSLCVLELIKYHGEWSGTATELLAELKTEAVGLKIDVNSKEWPKAANVLSRRLNELRTNMEEVGVRISIARAPGRNVSTITISKITEKPPQSPQHPQESKEDNEERGASGHSGDTFARLYLIFEELVTSSKGGLVPREAIDRAATHEGIAVDIVEKWITQQTKRGTLYSPRPGFLGGVK